MKIIVVGFCTMHYYVACNLPAIRRSAEGGGEVVLRAAVMGAFLILLGNLTSLQHYELYILTSDTRKEFF